MATLGFVPFVKLIYHCCIFLVVFIPLPLSYFTGYPYDIFHSVLALTDFGSASFKSSKRLWRVKENTDEDGFEVSALGLAVCRI